MDVRLAGAACKCPNPNLFLGIGTLLIQAEYTTTTAHPEVHPKHFLMGCLSSCSSVFPMQLLDSELSELETLLALLLDFDFATLFSFFLTCLALSFFAFFFFFIFVFVFFPQNRKGVLTQTILLSPNCHDKTFKCSGLFFFGASTSSSSSSTRLDSSSSSSSSISSSSSSSPELALRVLTFKQFYGWGLGKPCAHPFKCMICY